MARDDDEHGHGNGLRVPSFTFSTKGLVYLIQENLLVLLLLSVVLAGFAALGAGSIIGTIPDSAVQLLDQAQRRAQHLAPDDPSFVDWVEALGKSSETISDTTKYTGAPGGVVPLPPQAQLPYTTTQQTAPNPDIVKELVRIRNAWHANGDYTTALADLESASMLFNGVDYPVFDSLWAEVNGIKQAAESILPTYQGMLDGGEKKSDPVERLRLAQALLDYSNTVLDFTTKWGLQKIMLHTLATTAKSSANGVIDVVKGWAESQQEGNAANVANILKDKWLGTKWEVKTYEDLLLSCYCAQLVAKEPKSIAGITVNISSDVYKTLFPNDYGFLVTEIGLKVTVK